MTRLKQAWLALWGKLEPECDCDPPQGVLFGLDPPKGCHFEVICHRGASWHVSIYRGRRELANRCSLIGREGGDDEELIRLAASRALEVLEEKAKRSHLEGCYPPKIAKGKRRNG